MKHHFGTIDLIEEILILRFENLIFKVIKVTNVYTLFPKCPKDFPNLLKMNRKEAQKPILIDLNLK